MVALPSSHHQRLPALGGTRGAAHHGVPQGRPGSPDAECPPTRQRHADLSRIGCCSPAPAREPVTGESEGVKCMKIGFIGLGRMGSAMAANLVKAGHHVTVFNRSADKRRKLVELGAHEAARIADACRGEAVITMLADDAALSNVTLADGGIVASLPKGAIHVSMSTISVALARELTKAHAGAGQPFIAAPVFGRPEAAAAAKRFIVAAGEPAAVETCLPLLNALGQKTLPIGPEPAAANLVKLSGNFLLASAIEALGEGIALASKVGVAGPTDGELLTRTGVLKCAFLAPRGDSADPLEQYTGLQAIDDEEINGGKTRDEGPEGHADGALSGPVDDHLPAIPKDLSIRRRVRRGIDLDDKVGAVAVRQFADPRSHFLRAVVHDLVRTYDPSPCGLRFAAHGRDDPRSISLRQLHGVLAHRSGGTRDQHRPIPDITAPGDRVVRRHQRYSNRCAVPERHGIRQHDDLGRW